MEVASENGKSIKFAYVPAGHGLYYTLLEFLNVSFLYSGVKLDEFNKIIRETVLSPIHSFSGVIRIIAGLIYLFYCALVRFCSLSKFEHSTIIHSVKHVLSLCLLKAAKRSLLSRRTRLRSGNLGKKCGPTSTGRI